MSIVFTIWVNRTTMTLTTSSLVCGIQKKCRSIIIRILRATSMGILWFRDKSKLWFTWGFSSRYKYISQRLFSSVWNSCVSLHILRPVLVSHLDSSSNWINCEMTWHKAGSKRECKHVAHIWKSNSAVLKSPLTLLLLQIPLPTQFAPYYLYLTLTTFDCL